MKITSFIIFGQFARLGLAMYKFFIVSNFLLGWFIHVITISMIVISFYFD